MRESRGTASGFEITLESIGCSWRRWDITIVLRVGGKMTKQSIKHFADLDDLSYEAQAV
jgi:hypothetical protein